MASKDEIERETERGRGILSGPDRKWLLMDRDEFIEEHSRQYWGQRRDKVRERVRNALLDVTILWNHWDQDEMRSLLAEPTRQPGGGGFDDPGIYAGIRDAVAIALYLSGGETLIKDSRHYHPDGMAGQLFLEAFKRWGKRSSYFIDSVDIEVNGGYVSWPTILAQLEQGEDVDPEKLMLALQVEQVGADLERIQELLQEEVRNQLGMASGEGEERDRE